MADTRLERAARTVVDLLSDERICTRASASLRNLVADELKKAADATVPQAAIDETADMVADRVRNACVAVSPEARAIAVAVAGAAAVYAITQMPEDRIRAELEKAMARRINVLKLDLGFLDPAFRGLQMRIGTNIGVVFGREPNVRLELERQLNANGYNGTISAFAERDWATDRNQFGLSIDGQWSNGARSGLSVSSDGRGVNVYIKIIEMNF